MRTPRRSRLVTPDINLVEGAQASVRQGRLVLDPEGKRVFLDTGSELIEIGRAQEAVIGLAQTQVEGEQTEVAEWDDPVTLRGNLRRIRYVLAQITGSAWNSVAASLSWLKSKFHASSGHTHSGAEDDAPPIPWNNISGKPSAFPPQAHGSTHAPGSSDALPTAAPSGGLGTANAEGTSTAFARADHVHLAFDSTNPANVGSTPSPGTSTVAARRDHVHALADGVVTDAKIGNRTVSDANAPTSDTGTLTTLLGWLAYMIKAITGKANWRTVPAINLEALAAHKSRHATGGADALSPQDIGAAAASHTHAASDVTSGVFPLSRLAKCAPVWGDETEASSTSTSYTLIKEFRFYLNRSLLGFANQLLVVVEMRNSGSYQTCAGVYIDGTLRTEGYVTGTTYTVITLQVDISNISDGLHTISLYGKVSAGTGYWRYWEVWAVG